MNARSLHLLLIPLALAIAATGQQNPGHIRHDALGVDVTATNAEPAPTRTARTLLDSPASGIPGCMPHNATFVLDGSNHYNVKPAGFVGSQAGSGLTILASVKRGVVRRCVGVTLVIEKGLASAGESKCPKRWFWVPKKRRRFS